MRLEAKKYFYDIQCAAVKLRGYSHGKTFSNYLEDSLLRSGVERQFEIIGEALNQLSKLDGELAAKISQSRRIIAFRNQLIHGYADVDDRVVWSVLQHNLPTLLNEVTTLLE